MQKMLTNSSLSKYFLRQFHVQAAPFSSIFALKMHPTSCRGWPWQCPSVTHLQLAGEDGEGSCRVKHIPSGCSSKQGELQHRNASVVAHCPQKGPAGLGRVSSVPMPALMHVQWNPFLVLGPTGSMWVPPHGLRRGCGELGQILHLLSLVLTAASFWRCGSARAVLSKTVLRVSLWHS